MKKHSYLKLIFLSFGMMLSLMAISQVPKAINYQAIARTATGGVMFNQTVNLQISILDGSPNGASQYTEKHTVSTNQYGLFTLMIGHGIVVSGIFDSIPWQNGNQWVKTEMDALNTGVYTQVGSVQLLTVPYAYYSEKSGASSSTTATPVVKGIVNTDGTISTGSGFTVSHTANGVYQIIFDTPMTSLPVVNIAPEDTMGSAASGVSYPTSNASTTADDEIFNVTFGSLNNTSICGELATGTGSLAYEYSNYTSSVPAPTITAGSPTTASVTIGFCNGNAYTTSFSVYIDLDQNGDFLGAGENVYNAPGLTAAVGGTAFPFSVTVPVTAINGITRMRIVDDEGTIAVVNSTGTYLWGETEDYNINITGGVALVPVLLLSKVFASISDVTTSGFTFHIVNSGGTPVDQKFHFTAQ